MHRKLVSIGFPEPTPVATFRTIAHLFGTSKPRCGIYALCLSGERAYIGQAREVVRRFTQHLQKHDKIEGFAFIETHPSNLDEMERLFIREAERSGVVLANVTFTTNVIGATDLDDVVPPRRQQRWLADPAAVNARTDRGPRVLLPRAQVERYRPNFEKFMALDVGHEALVDLDLFISGCLPFPRATEHSFWSVSCMPSTGRRERLLCVNAGTMELFVVGYVRAERPPVTTWSFVNVSKSALFDVYGGERAFRRSYPRVRIALGPEYRDAGEDHARLIVEDQENLDMQSLLLDPPLQIAAATLALRVMRKRPTLYSQYHCQLLVNEAQGAFSRLMDSIEAVARWTSD